MSRILEQASRSGNATILYGAHQDVQQNVVEWLNTCLGIDQFDHLTEPDVQRAVKNQCDESIANLRTQLAHSIHENDSDIIAVVGHHSENDADAHRPFDSMHKTMSSVATWQTQARVVGLWVNESGQIDMLMQH